MNILHRTSLVAVAVFAAAAMAVSCGEPVVAETPITVSITNTSVPSAKGSQFVSVSTTGQWFVSIDGNPSWARLDAAGGTDNGHVILSWDANTEETARSLTISARTESGKYTATCTLRQDGAVIHDPTALHPDPVPRWLELPATAEGDGRYFFTHDMTVGDYTGRNYSLYLDAEAKVAVWVAYPLANGLIGTGGRTDDWGLDPKIPREYQSVVYKGYGRSSTGEMFQRGHQLPSADRLNYATNVTTFYGSNMTPQRGALNEHVWASLEGKVRNWASSFDTLYVVTGADIRGSQDWAEDNEGKHITVPVGYFKALLGYKKNGTLGITSTTGGFTAIGFYFEHRSYSDNAYMSQAMSISELEKKTGMEFFVNLDSRISKDALTKVMDTRDSWWK